MGENGSDSSDDALPTEDEPEESESLSESEEERLRDLQEFRMVARLGELRGAAAGAEAAAGGGGGGGGGGGSRLKTPSRCASEFLLPFSGSFPGFFVVFFCSVSGKGGSGALLVRLSRLVFGLCFDARLCVCVCVAGSHADSASREEPEVNISR